MSSLPNVDLSNTPGIYYAFAYWLATVFYVYSLPRRLRGWRFALVLSASLVVQSILLIATDALSVYWFIPSVFSRYVVMYMTLLFACDVSHIKCGYFCMRAFILGEFAASLEWQLFYYGLTVLHFPLNGFVNLMFLLLSHGAVFGAMAWLERKQRKSYATMQIPVKTFLAVTVMGASVFAASNLGYAFGNTPFSSGFPWEIYIIRTWVDLSGLILLFAYQIQLQEFQIRMEYDFMQQMMHMQYANYRVSKDSVALINQKYHDLKHQINILRNEMPQSDKLAYLDQLEQEIKAYETQNKTGNRVLDTILATKILKCQNLGISLTCVADGSALDFMHSMDISALFGNALDNAIESVSKISDPEKRLIHLSIARQKQFLRIRVENCYEGGLLYEGKNLITTKEDKHYHGYGLKSMEQTVRKYNGSMTIEPRDGWFELRILFPL